MLKPSLQGCVVVDVQTAGRKTKIVIGEQSLQTDHNVRWIFSPFFRDEDQSSSWIHVSACLLEQWRYFWILEIGLPRTWTSDLLFCCFHICLFKAKNWLVIARSKPKQCISLDKCSHICFTGFVNRWYLGLSRRLAYPFGSNENEQFSSYGGSQSAAWRSAQTPMEVALLRSFRHCKGWQVEHPWVMFCSLVLCDGKVLRRVWPESLTSTSAATTYLMSQVEIDYTPEPQLWKCFLETYVSDRWVW